MIPVWLVLGAALAAPDDDGLASRFDLGLHVPETAWDGAFDAPPVAQWKARLPGGRVAAGTHTERTRPVVVGDSLLVGSAGGSALYQLSRRDGSLLRTYPAQGSVESEAVVADDRVYFSDRAGSTWCYTLAGELVWQHRGSAPVLVRPTVAGGRVYVTNVDDLAVALDASDGELQWRYRRPPDLTREAELALYAAPPAVVLEDRVMLGFSDGSVVAMDAERGDIVWERPVGEGRYPDVVAAPVAWGGDLYASGYFTPLVAIDRETQNVRWRLELGAANAVALDATLAEPVLYHPGTDGVLRAVVARTGEQLWAWDSQTSGALTTPVLTDAGLVVASSDGLVYLVDAETGAEVWRYHEPRRLNGVTSAPTVAGRQLLFVSNAGWLHSMIVPRPVPEPPPARYPGDPEAASRR